MEIIISLWWWLWWWWGRGGHITTWDPVFKKLYGSLQFSYFYQYPIFFINHKIKILSLKYWRFWYTIYIYICVLNCYGYNIFYLWCPRIYIIFFNVEILDICSFQYKYCYNIVFFSMYIQLKRLLLSCIFCPGYELNCSKKNCIQRRNESMECGW